MPKYQISEDSREDGGHGLFAHEMVLGILKRGGYPTNQFHHRFSDGMTWVYESEKPLDDTTKGSVNMIADITITEL